MAFFGLLSFFSCPPVAIIFVRHHLRRPLKTNQQPLCRPFRFLFVFRHILHLDDVSAFSMPFLTPFALSYAFLSIVLCYGMAKNHSSNVEISPGSCPSSLAFKTRRMILPERVFGKDGTISISRGTAILPNSFKT